MIIKERSTGGGMQIIACSSRICNEAVRGDLGLDTLQGCRNKGISGGISCNLVTMRVFIYT